MLVEAIVPAYSEAAKRGAVIAAPLTPTNQAHALVCAAPADDAGLAGLMGSNPRATLTTLAVAVGIVSGGLIGVLGCAVAKPRHRGACIIACASLGALALGIAGYRVGTDTQQWLKGSA